MANSSRAGRPAGATSISRRCLALADSADTTPAEKLRALELAASLVSPVRKRASGNAPASPAAGLQPPTGEDKADRCTIRRPHAGRAA